jgi:hypothetical protein
MQTMSASRKNRISILFRAAMCACVAGLGRGCAVSMTHEETVEPPTAPVVSQPPGDPREVQTKIQLEQRYDAAMKISSFIDRDEALSGVATDAADAGNFDWAWAATKAISAFPVRDITARRCAEKFDAEGNRPIAQQFADSIASFQARDEVQRELAARAPAPPAQNPVDVPAVPSTPMVGQ